MALPIRSFPAHASGSNNHRIARQRHDLLGLSLTREKHFLSLQSGLRSFYDNPILSDVKIRQFNDGNTIEYFGHRLILAINSSFFKNAFLAGFQETTNPTISLHDDDPTAFRVVLGYIYGRDGSGGEAIYNAFPGVSILEAAIRLWIVCDKYMVERFSSDITSDIFSLARLYGEPGHPELTDFPDDLIQAVSLYYDHFAKVDTVMGRCLAKILLERFGDLKDEQGRGVIARAFEDIPLLAADVALEALGYDATKTTGGTVFSR